MSQRTNTGQGYCWVCHKNAVVEVDRKETVLESYPATRTRGAEKWVTIHIHSKCKNCGTTYTDNTGAIRVPP